MNEKRIQAAAKIIPYQLAKRRHRLDLKEDLEQDFYAIILSDKIKDEWSTTLALRAVIDDLKDILKLRKYYYSCNRNFQFGGLLSIDPEYKDKHLTVEYNAEIELDATLAILVERNVITEKESNILKLYYYYGYRQWEIAEMFGVSRSFICKLNQKALSRIHEYINGGKES